MQQRQREADRRERRRVRDAAVAEPLPGPTRLLTVRINPSQRKAKKRRVRLYDQADPDQDRAWSGDSRYLDLALFVYCRTADHVPDYWRHRSPLGRSDAPVDRHRMLTFHSGATWKKAGVLDRVGLGGSGDATQAEPEEVSAEELIARRDTLGILELALPESLSIELVAEVGHDLAFGVAARVGDRYDALAVGALELPEGIVLTTERTLVAKVNSRGLAASGVEAALEIDE